MPLVALPLKLLNQPLFTYLASDKYVDFEPISNTVTFYFVFYQNI